jgi:2-polyprenyl-6-methoxyphenol hydroxylase-like FAD-dependent oxidoreductase
MHSGWCAAVTCAYSLISVRGRRSAGANQAIEDADSLATLVGKHSSPDGPDWDRALADYTELRTVRTARVQRTAGSWGELWHCDGLFRTVRNALLTDRDPADYRYIDWLYGA